MEPTMAEKAGMFINGKVVEGTSARQSEVYNPSNGELIGAVPVATEAEIDVACCAAQAAFLN
jgi:aldehyde dehydrogenase (NAD+)